MHKVVPVAILFFPLICYAKALNKVKIHEGAEIEGINQWVGAISDDDTKPLLCFHLYTFYRT